MFWSFYFLKTPKKKCACSREEQLQTVSFQLFIISEGVSAHGVGLQMRAIVRERRPLDPREVLADCETASGLFSATR